MNILEVLREHNSYYIFSGLYNIQNSVSPKDQRVSDTMDLPLEERLQVQTDKRADDIDQESKIQLTEQSPQSSPLRPDRPILVESCCDSESDFDKTSIATREFE